MNATRFRTPRRFRGADMLLAPLFALLVAPSCERTPTKSDYVSARVVIECEGQTGEAFTLCRIEVIKRYMDVPLQVMQERFPPPAPKPDRFGCGGAG